MQNQKADGWLRLRGKPSWRAWSGYAFENLCLRHTEQLKAALGVASVHTVENSWRHRARDSDDDGAQIDLLIDRADGVINICEMKFTDSQFVIDKRYANELRRKIEVYRHVTRATKPVMLTVVSGHGIKWNSYAAELVASEVTADQFL